MGSSWVVTLCAIGALCGPHRVTVAPGEVLSITISGTGQPVLLIPGLFGGAYGFRNLVPQLVGQGFQTAVVEPLGIGASSRPSGADYSLTAQADRIAAALDSLGLRHLLVVAHSLGASMGMRMAYRHPDLVAGMVSLEGGPTEEIGTPAFRRAMRFAPLIRLFGGVGLIRGEIRRELKAASGDPQWVTDTVVRGYTAAAAEDLGGTLRAYRAMAHARESEPLAPHLGGVRCPVLLLVGTAQHDGGVDSAEVDLLTHRLASFAVDSVAGAGHYLQEERPSAVADALRRLRSQVGGEGSAPRREDTPCE